MNTYTWYQQLVRPSWAPPSWLFGPVWSVLYTGIAITFTWVFVLVGQKKVPPVVAVPFVLNIIFNAIFTPLQFGLRNNLLAAIDIVLVWLTLVWAILSIYPYSKWLAFAQIPYLLWVTFATVLQITITALN